MMIYSTNLNMFPSTKLSQKNKKKPKRKLFLNLKKIVNKVKKMMFKKLKLIKRKLKIVLKTKTNRKSK